MWEDEPYQFDQPFLLLIVYEPFGLYTTAAKGALLWLRIQRVWIPSPVLTVQSSQLYRSREDSQEYDPVQIAERAPQHVQVML